MFKVGDRVKLRPYNIRKVLTDGSYTADFIGSVHPQRFRDAFLQYTNDEFVINRVLSDNQVELRSKINTYCIIYMDNIEKVNDALVYYYGDPERGNEVIEALKTLGGIKDPSWATGISSDYIYCIFPDNIIRGTKDSSLMADFIKKFYTEAKLPELSKETITIKGKTYYTDEVEEGLKSLKEITK